MSSWLAAGFGAFLGWVLKSLVDVVSNRRQTSLALHQLELDLSTIRIMSSRANAFAESARGSADQHSDDARALLKNSERLISALPSLDDFSGKFGSIAPGLSGEEERDMALMAVTFYNADRAIDPNVIPNLEQIDIVLNIVIARRQLYSIGWRMFHPWKVRTLLSNIAIEKEKWRRGVADA